MENRSGEEHTTDLITRLCKLDAPDREVDAEIWLIELQSAESDPFGGYGLAEDWRYEYEAEEDGSVIQYARNGQVMHKIGRRSSPDFTGSTDAVIALAKRVFGKVGYSVAETEDDEEAPFAFIHVNGEAYLGEGATPAIALCIALLRAKEAST